MLKRNFSTLVLIFTFILSFGFILLNPTPVDAAQCTSSTVGRCFRSDVPGTTQCQVGAGNYWCCPPGLLADQATMSCVSATLPQCPMGRQCGSEALGGGTQCIAGTSNIMWCCPAGQDIDEVSNLCVTLDTGFSGDPTNTLTPGTFNELNPLTQFGDPAVNSEFNTPGSILSRVLDFAFPLAGLILFVMLVWSGHEILLGGTDKKSADVGKQRATAAVIGFALLFLSYWFAKLMEVIFGVKIL